MLETSKQGDRQQRIAPSINANARKVQKQTKKRKVFRNSAICALVFALSFSTTGAALALLDLSPVKKAVNVYGRITGDKDVKNAGKTLDSVDGYLREAQDLYRNISRKNLPGTVNQIESILGELGIISPSSYPRTLDEILRKVVLDGTLDTPEQIYSQQQIVIDTANSDPFWIYTDSTLGDGEGEGQTRLKAMNQTSVASLEATIEGEQRSTKASEQAYQNAELALGSAATSDELSAKAQGRKVSQDILKDVAAQQAELARSNSAVAGQLAALSDQQATSSGQLAQLATQSQVSNEHLSEMRVGQTISNIQLHDLFNAQRHANQMTVMEEQKNAQLSLGSTDAIYIPGLFSK